MSETPEAVQQKPSFLKRVWGLTFILFLSTLALGSWALASPVGSTPDEDFHLASIWCSSGGFRGMCEESPAPGNGTMMVSKSLLESQCYAHHPEISSGCQLKTGILNDSELVETVRGNFVGGYPPLFYATMHLFAGQDVQLSVVLMRFVNIFLFLALATASWISSPLYSRVAQKNIWLITSVPLGLFLIPSVNPSSWTIVGIAFAAIGLFGYFNSGSNFTKKWTNFGVFITAGLMAAGARADGAVYLVLTILAIGLVSFSNLKFNWKMSLPVLPMAVISILFYRMASQSSVAASGFGEDIFIDRTPFSVLAVNILTLPDLLVGAFGTWGLGWLDTSMPQSVWALSAASFLTVIVLAWQKLTKTQLLATIGLLIVAILLPLYVLQRSLAHVGEFLQPRYLLPLFVLIAFVALLAFNLGKFMLTSFTKILLVLALSIAQMMALYVNIDRYVHGASIKTGVNLDVGLEWWWAVGPTPMTTFVIGTFSFFILSYLLVRPFKTETTPSVSA